jgi:hypothetical protein
LPGRSCSPKAGKQEPRPPPVLLEIRTEVPVQQCFFPLRLDPKSPNDHTDSHNATPAADCESGTNRRQVQPGINWVPQARIRPGADELVIFFYGDSSTPVLAQMPARPNRQRDASPRKHYGSNADTKTSWDYSLAEKADVGRMPKEQNETDNFEKHDAVTRRKRFPLFGRLGIQRADRPIQDEGHPRDVD